MKRVIFLELYKHNRAFFSALLVFALSLIATALVLPQVSVEMDPLRSTRAMLTLMIGWGLPGVALLFGVSFASALRREPEITIEEPLPMRPLERVYGSYVASLIHLILFVLPVLLLLTPLLMMDTDSVSQLLQQTLLGAFTPAWWLLLLHVHTLGFVLAYWLRQPLLAGGLDAIVAGSSPALMKLATFTHFDLISYPAGLMESELFLALSFWSVVGIFAAHGCLKYLTKRLERGIAIRWTRGGGVVGLWIGIYFVALLILL